MFVYVLVFLIIIVMKSASVDVQCNCKRDTGFRAINQMLRFSCSVTNQRLEYLFCTTCGDFVHWKTSRIPVFKKLSEAECIVSSPLPVFDISKVPLWHGSSGHCPENKIIHAPKSFSSFVISTPTLFLNATRFTFCQLTVWKPNSR